MDLSSKKTLPNGVSRRATSKGKRFIQTVLIYATRDYNELVFVIAQITCSPTKRRGTWGGLGSRPSMQLSEVVLHTNIGKNPKTFIYRTD